MGVKQERTTFGRLGVGKPDIQKANKATSATFTNVARVRATRYIYRVARPQQTKCQQSYLLPQSMCPNM